MDKNRYLAKLSQPYQMTSEPLPTQNKILPNKQGSNALNDSD